jgi:UDP-GlcNAc3NAcA epimerase
MKIITVVGARPQFIKASPVSRAIKSFYPDATEIIVHTGQHFDKNMSDVFFNQLQVPKPHINLGIGGGTHGQNTGRMLEALEAIFIKEKADWVIVFGDTDSTLAASLSAAKLHIPVAHIEAGLRSFNKRMPEEINRIATDHVSELLFAPSELAKDNLLKENIPIESIEVVGDVMFDCIRVFKDKFTAPKFSMDHDCISNRKFALCTLHRAENTDDKSRLMSILDGLAKHQLPVILPIHPRTKAKIEEYNIVLSNNIILQAPLGYFEMQWMISQCSVVITDSGGLQKDAFYHRKPCITLRDETEWVELLELGANKLVGASSELICRAYDDVEADVFLNTPYGNGFAAESIARKLSAL